MKTRDGNGEESLPNSFLLIFVSSDCKELIEIDMNDNQPQITNHRLQFDPVTEDNPNLDGKNLASMAPLIFESSGSKVLGTMFLAGGIGLHPTALLLGGFPGNEVNFDIAHMIRRHGFNVFTFYPRGSFGSQGNYSWSNMVEDGLNAYKFLGSNFAKEKFNVDSEKIFFVGYSMGGFSALYNSILLGEVKNICAIAPFNAGFFGSFLEANPTIRDYSAEQMKPAMEFVNCHSSEGLLDEFILNQQNWNLLNYLETLSKKNILLIGAKHDSIAPLNLHHIPLQQKLQQLNKTFQAHILETGHSFSDRRIQLMKIIFEWINKADF